MKGIPNASQRDSKILIDLPVIKLQIRLVSMLKIHVPLMCMVLVPYVVPKLLAAPMSGHGCGRMLAPSLIARGLHAYAEGQLRCGSGAAQLAHACA